ncbi:MAG: phosphotransferase [Acidobacteriota bacterium]
MLPEAKADAVARALHDAFGVPTFEDIRMLTAGQSGALVFRIVVRGSPYLLRVVKDTGDAVGPGRGDQTNHFTCMKLAAEAGIAPCVWYTSLEDRVSITDFVDVKPFSRTEALARLPSTLRTLHALPPFPLMRTGTYLANMDGFVRRFLAAKTLPEPEAEKLSLAYERVAAAYPRDGSDTVSSHNDLNPENILFDGDRPWLVDWEASFQNDRYLDLAVVANFVVTNDAEEESYLRKYFGEAAGDYRMARFYLMRQLLHVFCPAVLWLLNREGKPMDSTAKAPDFRDFHNRLWAHEVNLAAKETKQQYARVHINQILQNMQTARFEDALRIVSQRASG